MDSAFGKILIVLGIVLVLVGIVMVTNIRIPFLGKLPGDIFYQGKNTSVFFPITTCIILSILLMLFFNLFRFFK